MLYAYGALEPVLKGILFHPIDKQAVAQYYGRMFRIEVAVDQDIGQGVLRFFQAEVFYRPMDYPEELVKIHGLSRGQRNGGDEISRQLNGLILKNAVAPCFGAFLASNLSRILCL